MARKARSRRGRRPARREPAIITQADPTPEQRKRYAYAAGQTVDPYGETLVQGRVKPHAVCRRQPVYVTLHGRGVICDRTRAVLDWYDQRLGLARKGLMIDSLALAHGRGGGTTRGSGGYTPTDAAAAARSDVQWARSFISEGLGVFDAVMDQEMTFAEIAGGSGAKAVRASRAFKAAAAAVLKGVGARVLRPV
jgi:hypothetical protein